MPNNTTFTAALLVIRSIESIDPLNQSFDTKDLLITSNDFTSLFIKQGKHARHLKQTLRLQKTDN